MQNTNHIDIGSTMCANRCDYKAQYIKDIVDDITEIQKELYAIQRIIGCTNIQINDNTTPLLSLEDFKNLTKIDYNLIKIRDITIFARRHIKYLERELLETNEELNDNYN